MTVTPKKKHHFIPVTYLKNFTDDDGKVYVFRKDDPSNPLHMAPESFGYRKHYYAQPMPDGDMDHNRIEDFFSGEIEGHWNGIVEEIRGKRPLKPHLEKLIQFIATLYVRVPATRDMV